MTDSDFNPHRPFNLADSPPFSRFFRSFDPFFLRHWTIGQVCVTHAGRPLAHEHSGHVRASQGRREFGRFWAIGEFLPPDRRTRLAQIGFGVFEPGFPIWNCLEPLRARNVAYCNSIRPPFLARGDSQS